MSTDQEDQKPPYTYEELEELEVGALKAAYTNYKLDLFYHKKRFLPANLALYLDKLYPCVTMRDNDEIYYFKSETGNYVRKGEIYLSELMKKIFGGRFSKGIVDRTLYDLRRRTYIDRKDFKLDPNLIPVANGILVVPGWNFDKIYLAKNDPKYYVMNRIPVRYDPDEKCPIFKEFLQTNFYIRDHPTLQEYVGYGLLRLFIFRKVIILVGPTRTGKSTLLAVLTNFYGGDNVVALPPHVFNDKFQRVRLYQKLANILNDISTKELKNTSYFKQIAGEDRISAERKFQEGFEFISYAVHFWSCNTLPRVYTDDSDAFFGRWLIIQVNKKQIKESEMDNVLRYRMTTKSELSGILNWALKGLSRLIKIKTFTNAMNAEETRDLWEGLSDSIGAFLHSNWIIFTSGGKETKDALYNHYVAYCTYKNTNPSTKKKFGLEISNRYVTNNILEHSTVMDGEKQRTAWHGIKILEPEMEPPEDMGDFHLH